MLTVQSGSMDADSESVQGIKTMNRQEKEDQAQIEYLRRWKEKKQKRKNLSEKLEKERPEMKYKAGDKVRVRSDLKERMGYGCQRFTDAMKNRWEKS